MIGHVIDEPIRLTGIDALYGRNLFAQSEMSIFYESNLLGHSHFAIKRLKALSAVKQ